MTSSELYAKATRVIPGGVNSPVRAWRAVGGEPRFIVRAEGAYLHDVDGRRYIDYVNSWGAILLGHADPRVGRAVQEALARGTSYGAATPGEVELAEAVRELFPSIEKLRLVSSGTEAVMSAVRVARAFTGRSRIVKFDGAYHGHADALLARAGSGAATFGVPDSAGVPAAAAADTLVLPFNDSAALAAAFEVAGAEIAAVIVEPVCGNMGVIPPVPGYLEELRRATRRSGALLIFDEVITGLRVCRGGAQRLYGVEPDLTCLGKVLGGGLPLAAFGGRAAIMDLLSPLGPVYQAGTLSGNPLAVAAGLATLKLLSDSLYAELEARGKRLEEGLREGLVRAGLEACINRVGTMLTLFFGVARVTDAAAARRCDRERFARFFHGMLERGVYWPPSPFEAAFLTLAHGEAELERTVEAFSEWLRAEA
jgi:glutamate-1-semialdehyde 2,1-aminomutase